MSLLYLDVRSVPTFGDFSAIISLNQLSAPFSFSPPSGTPIMCKSFTWQCPKCHVVFIHSFAFFFLFSTQTGYFHQSMTNFSTRLQVHRFFLLRAQGQCWCFLLHFFFISFIIFFSYRISIWFFFIISLCWTPHFSRILFLVSLSHLSVCSGSRLSFIETIILSYLSGNLQIPSSSGQLLESYCGFVGGRGW